MADKDEFEMNLISENNSKNRTNCSSSTRSLSLHVMVIEFIVIVVLIVFFTARENYLKQQLTTESMTRGMPITNKVTDVNPSVEPINSVCFPCGEVGENITSDDLGNMIRLDKKTSMCCMNDIGNLKKLFLMIMNEYYRNAVYGVTPQNLDAGTKHHGNSSDEEVGASGYMEDSEHTSKSTKETLSFWKQRVDAAHMFLDNKLLKKSNGTTPRIPWDGKDYHNLSMANNLVVYHPDKRSIQVTDSGLYFIYSSITLQAPRSDLNAQVYHTLLREHYLLPKTGSTMMMINKYGGGNQSRGFYTSFLCGAFRLRKGDEVFVKVSNISFVYNSYYSNYLGLYRF